METKFLLGFLLCALIIGNWYIDAAPQALPQVDFSQNATVGYINDHKPSGNETHLRETRLARPYYGFIGIWNTLGNIRYIFTGQKNETSSALQRILNTLQDGFSDTATKKPYTETTTVSDSQDLNATTTTTTERYRISRRELGYILGRNYRGLKKLFRIELNDALNQSQYNIKEYKQEAGKSISQFTVPKEVPAAKTTTISETKN